MTVRHGASIQHSDSVEHSVSGYAQRCPPAALRPMQAGTNPDPDLYKTMIILVFKTLAY